MVNLGTFKFTTLSKLISHFPCSGKAEITKQVIEGLEKDLDKLRRLDENYKNRQHFKKTGVNLLEETEEDREKIRV